MRDWMSNYERLLRQFSACLSRARILQTPNPEDDLCVRIAIVGYSFYSLTEDWDYDDLRYVQDRASSEYSAAALLEHDERGRAYGLFACLALGYLLGLARSGYIDQAEFVRGEALLPAFLAMHSTQLPILSPSAR